ncbi:MAG: hypothetical protein WA055_05355 [Candidatus Moraniibacteriota bacterium]
MNNSTLPIIIFVTIVLVVSAISHSLIKNYGKAIIVSATISAILFQIMAYVSLGYLDPFFIIAIFITGVIAVVISAIVGVPFKINR